MAKERKITNLTVRVDETLLDRLEKLEKTTPLGRAEITRQALDAVLRHFEETGKVNFPVSVIPTSMAPTLDSPAYPIISEEMLHNVVQRLIRPNQITGSYEQAVRMVREACSQPSAGLLRQLDAVLEKYGPEGALKTGEAVPISVIQHNGNAFRSYLLEVEGIAHSTPNFEPKVYQKHFAKFLFLLHDVTADYPFPIKIYRWGGPGYNRVVSYGDYVIAKTWSFLDLPEPDSIIICESQGQNYYGKLEMRPAKDGEQSDSKGNTPVLKLRERPFEMAVRPTDIRAVFVAKLAEPELVEPHPGPFETIFGDPNPEYLGPGKVFSRPSESELRKWDDQSEPPTNLPLL